MNHLQSSLCCLLHTRQLFTRPNFQVQVLVVVSFSTRPNFQAQVLLVVNFATRPNFQAQVLLVITFATHPDCIRTSLISPFNISLSSLLDRVREIKQVEWT